MFKFIWSLRKLIFANSFDAAQISKSTILNKNLLRSNNLVNLVVVSSYTWFCHLIQCISLSLPQKANVRLKLALSGYKTQLRVFCRMKQRKKLLVACHLFYKQKTEINLSVTSTLNWRFLKNCIRSFQVFMAFLSTSCFLMIVLREPQSSYSFRTLRES